ncbi:MAG TPA: winged helix DNA-binding domain-containing protein [Aggregatilineales bacterium]|nr:winged helix DNA-binding domain-containing protein [Aggregatilineales bacterium]
MTKRDIAYQRLHNQHLAGTPFEKPADVVQWLGAVQAQDYAGAKWALALRTGGLTDAEIEQECRSGAILRTHVLRPTWHFVVPADIRWMLELTGPRVIARLANAYRITELDSATFARSNDALIRALRGGKQLTRWELERVLNEAGIDTHKPLRFGHLLMRAELEGIMCSGAWRGKQPSWALLDDRAPQAKSLPRDAALAELTRRYFTSHGPATLKAFMWWSGLNAAEAKAGLEMVKSELQYDAIDGTTYWFAGPVAPARGSALSLYLLPNYDEYIVAYTDRSAIYDQRHATKLDARGNVLFNHTIVINSQVAGTWKRTFKKGAVVIESAPFVPLSAAEERAFKAAAQRYGEFLGLPVLFA